MNARRPILSNGLTAAWKRSALPLNLALMAERNESVIHCVSHAVHLVRSSGGTGSLTQLRSLRSAPSGAFAMAGWFSHVAALASASTVLSRWQLCLRSPLSMAMLAQSSLDGNACAVLSRWPCLRSPLSMAMLAQSSLDGYACAVLSRWPCLRSPLSMAATQGNVSFC
jgi:hypothetical protein